MSCWVGESYVRMRRCDVRNDGGIRSENDEISKDKEGEKKDRRKKKG